MYNYVAFLTTSTTPPVTVVYSGALLITTTVKLAPTSVGQTTSGQHDVVLLPQLILRDTVRASVALITLHQQQQPPIPDAPSAMCPLCIGPSIDESVFQSSAFH